LSCISLANILAQYQNQAKNDEAAQPNDSGPRRAAQGQDMLQHLGLRAFIMRKAVLSSAVEPVALAWILVPEV